MATFPVAPAHVVLTKGELHHSVLFQAAGWMHLQFMRKLTRAALQRSLQPRPGCGAVSLAGAVPASCISSGRCACQVYLQQALRLPVVPPAGAVSLAGAVPARWLRPHGRERTQGRLQVMLKMARAAVQHRWDVGPHGCDARRHRWVARPVLDPGQRVGLFGVHAQDVEGFDASCKVEARLHASAAFMYVETSALIQFEASAVKAFHALADSVALDLCHVCFVCFATSGRVHTCELYIDCYAQTLSWQEQQSAAIGDLCSFLRLGTPWALGASRCEPLPNSYVLQRRHGISTGFASSVSSSRKAAQTQSRKATQPRTVHAHPHVSWSLAIRSFMVTSQWGTPWTSRPLQCGPLHTLAFGRAVVSVAAALPPGWFARRPSLEASRPPPPSTRHCNASQLVLSGDSVTAMQVNCVLQASHDNSTDTASCSTGQCTLVAWRPPPPSIHCNASQLVRSVTVSLQCNPIGLQLGHLQTPRHSITGLQRQTVFPSSKLCCNEDVAAGTAWPVQAGQHGQDRGQHTW